MSKKSDYFVLLILLIVLFFLINYHLLFNSSEKVFVDRVIDGDTIEVNGESIRLLGINTPERGEIFYEEAKNYLSELVLNKSVELIKGKENRDKYSRLLRYVFIDGENVNMKIVENGFANPYFPAGRDKYFDKFYFAWNNCFENLCEISKDKCAGCIGLDYSKKILVIENNCGFDCDLDEWIVTGEGRKKIVLNSTLNKDDKLVLDLQEILSDEDTIFLRDNKGNSVFYEIINLSFLSLY